MQVLQDRVWVRSGGFVLRLGGGDLGDYDDLYVK